MGRRGAVALMFGAAGAWAVGVACSSFDEGAEPANDGGGAVDGGTATAETGPVDSGGDAALAALAPNGDFEAPGPGCGGGWDQTYFVTLEKTTPGRDGGNACRVCTVSAPPNGAAGYYAVDAPVPGTYTLEAWHNKVPGQPAAATANIQLQAFDGDGGYTLKAARPTVGATWSAGQTSIAVPPGTTQLYVGIGMWQADGGECLAFDDVVLTRK